MNRLKTKNILIYYSGTFQLTPTIVLLSSRDNNNKRLSQLYLYAQFNASWKRYSFGTIAFFRNF